MPKGVSIPKYMTFDGKRYTYYDSYDYPGEANHAARSFRSKGHLARVVRKGEGVRTVYCVYTRKSSNGSGVLRRTGKAMDRLLRPISP